MGEQSTLETFQLKDGVLARSGPTLVPKKSEPLYTPVTGTGIAWARGIVGAIRQVDERFSPLVYRE